MCGEKRARGKRKGKKKSNIYDLDSIPMKLLYENVMFYAHVCTGVVKKKKKKKRGGGGEGQRKMVHGVCCVDFVSPLEVGDSARDGRGEIPCACLFLD